jgi:hypothetical protein
MITLRYDWQSADKMGYKGHPQKVMQQLGYKVLAYEAVGIADCSFMEVEEVIEPLPEFLKVSDYKLVV